MTASAPPPLGRFADLAGRIIARVDGGGAPTLGQGETLGEGVDREDALRSQLMGGEHRHQAHRTATDHGHHAPGTGFHGFGAEPSGRQIVSGEQGGLGGRPLGEPHQR